MENDRWPRPRYAGFMLPEWLHRVLEAKGWGQAELGRMLTEALGKSIDRAAVNKMLSGIRAISAEELIAIERLSGMAAPVDIQVPLKGRVGAGAQVFAIDHGSDTTVDAPAECVPGTVAVMVEGESMFPAIEEGSLLFYSRQLPPSEMINRRAIVQLEDDRIFVKVLRAGSAKGTWTLQSVNPNYPDMVDQIVRWAAPIDWIRPR